jgi:Fe-S cluster biogenesis protein NfuA/nitrite reductase/ring-hydroxylating ferredoxin subunit
LEDQQLQESVGRIESLLGEIESFEDPHARAKTAEMVQTLLQIYGEGLARIVDTAAQMDGGFLDALAEDELVSPLLILHDLHPATVEDRVLGALEEVRPYLESHGGDVELVAVEGGVALMRMQGSCEGCPSSAMTLKLAIEEAVLKAAPELEGVEAEGATEPATDSTIVAGPTISRKKKKQPEKDESSWTTVGGLPQLSGGGTLAKEVSGMPVLFLKLGGDLYAYRNLCPGCDESLERGVLDGTELACPGCGDRYDVRRAGRGLDTPQHYLDPVPLLVDDNDLVKVAVPETVG